MNQRLSQILDLLREDPGSAFLQFALAKEYEGMGDSDKALEHYRKLTEEHPEYTGTYFHFAQLLMENDQTEEGFRMYDKGIAICKLNGDQHSLAELQNARMNWEMEL